MEEILASIRRIIAEDDTGKSKLPEPASAPRPSLAVSQPRVPAPPPPQVVRAELAPSPAAPEDVLELTADMEVQPEVPSFRKIEPSNDLTFDEPPAERPEAIATPAPEPPLGDTVESARRHFQYDTGPDRSLISQATTAAVDAAFNSLAQTVLVQNSLTLDDLVREMLRPMLKAWLDDNLPNMVERLVRAEIERVARGRG